MYLSEIESILQTIYKRSFLGRPLLSIGLSIKGVPCSYMENVAVLLSEPWGTITAQDSILILYHVFSSLTLQEQEHLAFYIQSQNITTFIIDYTLAERTLEWFCTPFKYMYSYWKKEGIADFMRRGGLYNWLYKYEVTSKIEHRFPLTQEAMILIGG